MPEALAAIPALKLPTGNLSETDASNSDRSNAMAMLSSNSASTSNQAKKRQLSQSNSGQNKKLRRSNARRLQKKSSLKASSQQKTATSSVLQIKSHIPRALLTPSTSSASLNTNVSPSPRIIPKKTTATTNSRTGQSSQTRKDSVAIVKFRWRKSYSQMDLKHARRSGNYSSPSMSAKTTCMAECADKNNNSMVPTSMICADMSVSSQNSLMNKFLEQENYYYVVQKQESKVAGMKIFATIMLNAWRKRRDEVKKLTEEVNDLKRGSVKAKNQLHVFNTLFRVEQRRNDELNLQLKRSLDDINNAKSSCESLTTSLISLKADKALLEQELQIKEQEFDGLNAMLTQTKSDLFKAMTQQRELQTNLSCEQRKVQTLENQKNDLINEICELNNDALQKEEKLREELITKNEELINAQDALKKYHEVSTALVKKDIELRACIEMETKMRNEIDFLQADVSTLRCCLQSTLDSRIKSCWHTTVAYHKATFNMLHWIVYCLLPATPPPKLTALPFGLTLEKALNIVRR